MANEAVYYGTGRRKNAVARVRLVPGTGKVTVNGREAMNYFGREALRELRHACRSRLPTPRITSTSSPCCNGGGISGQAGALRHGISRALLRGRRVSSPSSKKAGFLTRDPRMVERKKYGLKKARKRPQFSKRWSASHTSRELERLVAYAASLSIYVCRSLVGNREKAGP